MSVSDQLSFNVFSFTSSSTMEFFKALSSPRSSYSSAYRGAATDGDREAVAKKFDDMEQRYVRDIIRFTEILCIENAIKSWMDEMREKGRAELKEVTLPKTSLQKPTLLVSGFFVPNCTSNFFTSLVVILANTFLPGLVDNGHRLREKFAQDRDSKELKQPHLLLTSVYESNGNADAIFKTGPGTSGSVDVPVVFPTNETTTLPPSTVSVTSTLKEFQRNWDVFTESSLRGIDWTNVFAAGGSVLACLIPLPGSTGASNRARRSYYHENAYVNSDIDLFVYGLDEEAANAKLLSLYEQISDALPYESVVFRSKHAVTIVSQFPFRHVQIVLRRYLSPAEILMGFDVDCCAVGYDGKNVWTLPRTHRSLITRINRVDLSRRSPSYEMRLAKYASRGFQVAVPSLDRSRIDPQLFEKPFDKLQGLARLLLLERLRTPEARKAFKNNQRLKKLRPDQDDGVPFWRRLNRRFSGDKFLTERIEESGAEVSDYSTVFLPWSPSWTAKRIRKLMYTKDAVLNSSWYDPSKKVHTHPCFFGTMEEVMKDCCGNCPTPPGGEGELIAPRVDPKTGFEDSPFVSGPLTWIDIDPGRQSIGSFHPITDGDWSEGAYTSDDTVSLARAIADGDLTKVKSFFQGPPPVPAPPGESSSSASPAEPLLESKDAAGRTPLLLATLCGQTEIAKFFVDRGARLTARLSDGRTALHVAATYGHVGIIQAILVAGVKVQAANAPIKEAAEEAAEEAEEGRNRRDLAEKAKAAAAAVAELDDWEVDDEDWDHAMTPLGYAVFFGRSEAIKVLVQEGQAQLARQIVVGGTKKSAKKKQRYYHQQKKSYPLLHLAMLNKSGSQVQDAGKVLLDLGYNVNVLDADLRSALMVAARFGAMDWLKLLVSAPNVKIDLIVKASSALSIALQRGAKDVAELLLEAGAKPFYTVEDVAADQGKQAGAKNSGGKKARVRRFGFGRTNMDEGGDYATFVQPLHHAVSTGDLDLVSVVIKALAKGGEKQLKEQVNVVVNNGTALDQVQNSLTDVVARDPPLELKRQMREMFAAARDRAASVTPGSWAAWSFERAARELEARSELPRDRYGGRDNTTRASRIGLVSWTDSGIHKRAPTVRAAEPVRSTTQTNTFFYGGRSNSRRMKKVPKSAKHFGDGPVGPTFTDWGSFPEDHELGKKKWASDAEEEEAIAALNAERLEEYRSDLVKMIEVLKGAGGEYYVDLELPASSSPEQVSHQQDLRKARDTHVAKYAKSDGSDGKKKEEGGSGAMGDDDLGPEDADEFESDPWWGRRDEGDVVGAIAPLPSWMWFSEMDAEDAVTGDDENGPASEWLQFENREQYKSACLATMKLFEAVYANDLDAVKKLTSEAQGPFFPKGIFVAVVAEDGDSPLTLAVSLGHVEVAVELIAIARRQCSVPKPKKKRGDAAPPSLNNWDLVAGADINPSQFLAASGEARGADEAEIDPLNPSGLDATAASKTKPFVEPVCYVSVVDFILESGAVYHMAADKKAPKKMLKALMDAIRDVPPSAPPVDPASVHPSMRKKIAAASQAPLHRVLSFRDNSGLTAFEWAVATGNLDGAKTLLEAGGGFDVGGALRGGYLSSTGAGPATSVPHYAGLDVEAGKKDDEGVKRFNPKASLNLAPHNALHVAIFHGQVEVLRWLMDGSADKIYRKWLDQHPKQIPESVRELLKDVPTFFRPMRRRSVSPNNWTRANTGRETPLLMAMGRIGSHVRPEHEAAVKEYLKLEKIRLSGVTGAARQWLPESMTRVLETRGQSGLTPLIAAAGNGSVGLVQILLEAGADVNGRDRELGWTALHHAAWHGREDVVKVLLEAGADRDDAGREYATDPLEGERVPLAVAVARGYGELGNEMCRSGDAGQVDKEGWSMAHVTAVAGWAQCLKLMAPANVFDPAPPSGMSDAARLARTGGAELRLLNTENATGMTPVDCAMAAWASSAFRIDKDLSGHTNWVGKAKDRHGSSRFAKESRGWRYGTWIETEYSSGSEAEEDLDVWDRHARAIDFDRPAWEDVTENRTKREKGETGWTTGSETRPQDHEGDPRGARCARETALALLRATQGQPRVLAEPGLVRVAVDGATKRVERAELERVLISKANAAVNESVYDDGNGVSSLLDQLAAVGSGGTAGSSEESEVDEAGGRKERARRKLNKIRNRQYSKMRAEASVVATPANHAGRMNVLSVGAASQEANGKKS